jgi:hypothetical protein
MGTTERRAQRSRHTCIKDWVGYRERRQGTTKRGAHRGESKEADKEGTERRAHRGRHREEGAERSTGVPHFFGKCPGSKMLENAIPMLFAY